MNDDPRPSLPPTDFLHELINRLQQHKNEKGFAPEAMTSIAIRYDNGWIGGILEDFQDGTTGLTELLRIHIKCAVIDQSYSRTVSTHIEPQLGIRIPEHMNKAVDYTLPATVVQIGNVNVSFILAAINSDAEVISS